MARAVVAAKIANGCAVLDLYRKHNEVSAGFAERRKRLEESIAASASAKDIAALDGVEGSAAREYFGLAMEFNRSEMVWAGRVKHPATDPLNALLSLTCTLLMNEMAALLEGAGCDPYLGFLHQVDYGRPSLALDLMEPFRHPVADRLALWLVNKRVLEAEDFSAGGEGRGVFLAAKPMRRFFEEYEKWIRGRARLRAAERGSARNCGTRLRNLRRPCGRAGRSSRGASGRRPPRRRERDELCST